MMTRRSLLALLGSASALTLAGASAAAQPKICRPWEHIWVPIGTAPGTGRPVLRCTRCGLTKIQ